MQSSHICSNIQKDKNKSMLFFRIYHLSAKKYIGIWKKLYAHKAYNYHNCLNRKASF